MIAQREGKFERVAELLGQAINVKGDSIKIKANLALACSETSAKSSQIAIEAFSQARKKPCKRHTLELLAVLRAYLTWKYLTEAQAQAFLKDAVDLILQHTASQYKTPLLWLCRKLGNQELETVLKKLIVAEKAAEERKRLNKIEEL